MGSLMISDAGGRSVRQAITPGSAETQRFDLRAMTQGAHLAGTEGGMTVEAPTGGGNLITSHIVFDETTGMSATMKAFERDPTEKPKAHTMRAPMMALANPDPVLMFPSGTKLVPQVFPRISTGVPLRVGASFVAESDLIPVAASFDESAIGEVTSRWPCDRLIAQRQCPPLRSLAT